MKQNMTMEEFLAEVTRREDAKKDLLVGPRKMMMDQDDSRMVIEGEAEFLPVQLAAHGQLATRLGIPKTYYDNIARVPGLRAHNVNALLGVDNRKTFVRTLDGSARAFLSDAYKPIDNFLVLQGALPALKEHDGLQVTASELSDSRMYLQVVFPRLQGEVTVGDVVQAGVTLTNSEVGSGAVDVKSFVRRLRCKNGMIGESVLRSRHAGRRVGEDYEDYDIYSSETIRAEMESFRLRLRDILKASVSEAAFERTLNMLKEKAGQIIPGDKVEAAVENVTKRFTLTQDEGKSVLANLWGDGDRSRWGLANAVTYLVHGTKDLDRQYDLERAGYELMAMPDREFAVLVA